MKLRVIVTGATGMVGEGVLHECLRHPNVERVLVINRKPGGVAHVKLREIIHPNFFDLTAIQDQLTGYNACLFCLGVSSVGMNEAEYRSLTYDLTLRFAKTLVERNPGMAFCYVSGAGTDSTERGNSMWARVKGKTENDLLRLPFRAAYMFRPGFLKPAEGAKHVKSFYKYIGWLYTPARALFPGFVSTLGELGQAMLKAADQGYEKPILEVADIVRLAKT